MSQFLLGSDPFWAWVYAVLDPQDAIKELLNCVLRVVGQKSGGPTGPPLVKFLGFQPVLLLKFKRTAQHPQKLEGVLPARPNPPKETLWKPQDSAPFGL